MFVYKINTNLTKSEAENLYKTLSIQEIEELESYDMKAYDVEINGKMSSYVIISRLTLVKIMIFLRQKEIKFTYEDISSKVFLNQITFDDEAFNKEIQKFIEENITIDDILDKINLLGINSLTNIDKKILSQI